MTAPTEGPYSTLKPAWHMDRIADIRAGKQARPINLQLIISDLCNMDCGYCLPAGSLVLTADGYEPIETIEVGTRVFGHDGQLHRVSNTMVRSGTHPAFFIRPEKHGMGLTATGEHPVFVRRAGVVEWVEAKNVVPGDMVAIRPPEVSFVSELQLSTLLDGLSPAENGHVRAYKGKTTCPNRIPLNTAFGEFVGAFLGDGCVQPHANRPDSFRVSLTFGAHEEWLIEKMKLNIRELFNLETTITSVEDARTIRLTISSSIVGRLMLALCRTGSHSKQFNPALLGAPTEFLEGMLRGYAWADRCLDDKSLATVSKPLALAVQALALRLGLSPTLFAAPGRPGLIKGRVIQAIGDRYTIRFRGDDRNVFDRIVGTKSDVKHASSWHVTERDETGFCWFKVKTVEPKVYDGPVYNLEVEGTNSYLAENLVVHNCAYRASAGLSSEQFGGLDAHGRPTHNPNRMIPADKVREILVDAHALGVKSITWTGGGEPTVHPQHIELFRAGLDLGLECSMNTNGALLRPGWSDVFPRFTYIRFSFDGATPAEYAAIRRTPESTFGTVLRNMRAVTDAVALAKSACVVGAGYVVTPEFYKSTAEAVRQLRDTGVAYVRLASMQSTAGESVYSDIADVRRVVDECRKLGEPSFRVVSLFDEAIGQRMSDPFCGFQQLVLYIGGNQKVYRCCYVAYTGLGEIGDLSQQSLRDWFASPAKQVAIDSFDARACLTCPLAAKNATISYMVRTPMHVNFP